MTAINFLRWLRVGSAGAFAILCTCLVFATVASAGPECRGGGRKTGDCGGGGGNEPPVISGSPATQATVGTAYAFTPVASDPEGKTLSFSIVNKPPWAAFSTSTGRLSGTPGTSAIGEHVGILIEVSDGRKQAALAPFSIVVSSANRAPSIAGLPPTSAREGQFYEFRPTASDPDGDSLTFGVTNRPAWASFDSATGRLWGTPGAGAVGTYSNIVIRVSDGTLAAALPAYAIAVAQVSMGSATLSWVAPTQREDGTPLVNLAGYRIRYGTAPGSYPNVLHIQNPGITSCVIENLPAGTYYFVATAYDSSGYESAYSAVVSKTIG